MDFVGDAWSGYMKEIHTNCNTNTRDDLGLNQYMSKARRLLKKKSNLYCHIEFFQQYIHDKICPIGLSVQLFPSFRNTSSEFRRDWELELMKCSTELIKILVTQYKSDLQSLDQELVALQTQYDSIRSHKLFDKKWQELKEYLKLKKDIIAKKQTKIYKDKMAFAEGYAYHWHSMPSIIWLIVPEKKTLSQIPHYPPLFPPPLFPPGTRSYANSGTRKRGYNGSPPATPHPKKSLDTNINHTARPPNHQQETQCNNPLVTASGPSQQSNHLGPYKHYNCCKHIQLNHQILSHMALDRAHPMVAVFQHALRPICHFFHQALLTQWLFPLNRALLGRCQAADVAGRIGSELRQKSCL